MSRWREKPRLILSNANFKTRLSHTNKSPKEQLKKYACWLFFFFFRRELQEKIDTSLGQQSAQLSITGTNN